MTNIITIKAPAKINLTLDVTGIRSNGYHDLKMIMQTIDLYDELSIERIPADSVILTMNKELPDKIPPEKNLVYKAADIIRKQFNITEGVKIHLTKNIPAAAGLAGGSSDCAATLIAMNQLFGLNLSVTQLCDIGVSLGADVPFCISKGTMLSEGIGEILTKLPVLYNFWAVLIKPDISVSTKYVYTALDSKKLFTHPDNDKMIGAIKDNNIKDIISCLSNVLETVTIPEYPVIDELKQFLSKQQALGVLMSGSGPTAYGLFTDKEIAQNAYKHAQKIYPDYDVILCQTRLPI